MDFFFTRLQEEEIKNRTLEHKRGGDTRSNGAMSSNGTLKRRVPSYVSYHIVLIFFYEKVTN